MSTDFLVHDDGEPDAIAPQVQQHALEDLPVCFDLSARESLLRDRSPVEYAVVPFLGGS
jgi:hypothetical protein